MNDKEPLQIYGTVEEIIFRNDSNGYTVIKMLSEGTDVTAHGLMAAVNTGDELRLFGAWENHPSYGRQFSFEYYEQYLPSTADSILKYLSKGHFCQGCRKYQRRNEEKLRYARGDAMA